MQLVILAAGKGLRYKNSGFENPKPLINIQDKPLFWWAAESAMSSCSFSSLHFAVLKDHVLDFAIDEEILKYYPFARIHVLDAVTSGAAETLAVVANQLIQEKPFCSIDCDLAFSFYEQDAFKFFEGSYAGLCTFNSIDPAYSYAKINEYSQLIKTYEKKVISQNAIAGIYYFKTPQIYMENYSAYRLNCEYTELYISGIFNIMIERCLKISVLPLKNHISLGTPENLLSAREHICSLDWIR